MARVLGADLYATVLNQDIYEISATQKHRLGTRVIRGDKVYRYVKAGATMTTNATAAWSIYNQTIAQAVLQAAYPIGASRITLTVAATDGVANDGVFAENALEGGSILIGLTSAYAEMFHYTIRGNLAKVAGAGTLTIDLDGELPVALTTSSYAEAHVSPYSDVRTGNHGGFAMCLGVAQRLLTTTYPYGWVQTWGPTWIAPQTAVGSGWHAQEVVFRDDGSVGLRTDADAPGGTAYTINGQHAGVVMSHAQDNTQGAPLIFLQVAP